MNIRLEQTGIVSGKDEIENNYATYGRNAVNVHAKQTSAKNNTDAISMQFGTLLSDNGMNAYAQNGMPVAENDLTETMKQQGKHQDFMVLMSNIVSEDELGKMYEEGYDPSDMDPEQIVTVVDEIKAKMAESGVIVEGYNDDLKRDTLAEVLGSSVIANQILSESQALSDALGTYDIPATDKNIDAINQTGKIATELGRMSESAIKYMLKNHLSPTIENIYTAEFSGSRVQGHTPSGYYSNDGFLAKKADDASLDQVVPQIQEVIEKAGFEANEAMIADGKWMIENGLELTKQSFSDYQQLKNLDLPLTYEQGVNAAAVSLKDTGSVKNAKPGVYETAETQAVHKIGELDELIETEEKFAASNEDKDSNENNENLPFDKLSYYRQLQETRLVMNVSNTAFLIKNNISIDFGNLNQLVDNLKTAENVIRERLFGLGSPKENNRAADLFDYTNKVVQELPSLPAHVLGGFTSRSLMLESVYQEGISLQAKYEKAGLSYEALMTEVRSDLGDSIKTAFARVDSLLEENGIEPTKANERAARILGYNEMAVTKENIDAVREADQKLTRVIGKMQPAAVLSLIRDGINPVTMDIDELEARLNERQQENDIKKYSEFLVKLEENHQISHEERQGYIGIYRMLHQIESKDGAALGALIEQGGEMTLGNLLTQVRNRKNSGIDAKIDDSFGLLDKVVTAKASITDQISAAFADNSVSDNAFSQNAGKRIKEDLTEAADIQAQVESILEYSELPPKIKNVNGASALIKDRGALLKNVKKIGRENEGILEATGNSDSVIDQLLENFTDRDTAKESYDKMLSAFEQQLNENAFSAETSLEIRDINQAINALGICGQLAKNEHYEIPMEIGGEEGSMSVHLVHNKGTSPEVRVYTETEGLGRISASFVVKAKGIEGYIESDRLTTVNEFKSRAQELTDNLKKFDISVSDIFFEQNVNAGLKMSKADMGDSSVLPENAGVVNTSDLYKVAKEFIKVMAN